MVEVVQINGTPTGRRQSSPEPQELPRYRLMHPRGRVDNASYLAWVLDANGGVFPPPLADVLLNAAVRNAAGFRPVQMGLR